jgi:hypothetical protein
LAGQNPPSFQQSTGLCFAAQARSTVHEGDRIRDISSFMSLDDCGRERPVPSLPTIVGCLVNGKANWMMY